MCQGVVEDDFHLVLPMGQTANREDLESSAPSTPLELLQLGDITISASKDMAYATFLVREANSGDQAMVSLYTVILGRKKDAWVLVHAQKTLAFPLSL
jgi:hypothetical protein